MQMETTSKVTARLEGQEVPWLVKGAPSVFDMDIGKDPDDSIVAAIVALNRSLFNPVLLITNDEAESLGRARFLRDIMTRLDSPIRIAAGLPSVKKRVIADAEEHALVSGGSEGFEHDGIAALREVLEDHSRVNYFGLGALTNLAAVLEEAPHLADRVTLIQMGPAFAGAFPRPNAQYNVRLDVESFRRVLGAVDVATCVMTHSSWGRHAPGGEGARQHLGIYKDDPVYEALRTSGNEAYELIAQQLAAWAHPCSIMHDPLTVMSQYNSHMVGFRQGTIRINAEGLADASLPTIEHLKDLPMEQVGGLHDYTLRGPVIQDGDEAEARFSLAVNYDLAREAITRSLFPDNADLPSKWKEYNASQPAPPRIGR